MFEQGEAISLVERHVSGLWATTDRALYVIEYSGRVNHFPLSNIYTVQIETTQRIATIRTTRGEVVIVGTKRNSAILKQLTQLVQPTDLP